MHVGDFCTVVWRGEKYRVECTPSYLLSLACKIAEAECVPYPEIYRQILNSVEGEYRGIRRLVSTMLSEK